MFFVTVCTRFVHRCRSPSAMVVLRTGGMWYLLPEHSPWLRTLHGNILQVYWEYCYPCPHLLTQNRGCWAAIPLAHYYKNNSEISVVYLAWAYHRLPWFLYPLWIIFPFRFKTVHCLIYPETEWCLRNSHHWPQCVLLETKQISHSSQSQKATLVHLI